MMMPVEELEYDGPVGVCLNDNCSYYERSFAHTSKQMGINVGYRHAFVCAEGKELPVSIRVSDNPSLFCPVVAGNWIMEQGGDDEARLKAIKVAVKQWNAACDWAQSRVDALFENKIVWTGKEIVVH